MLFLDNNSTISLSMFQVMIQHHNRHMSISYYISALAVTDTIALLIGKFEPVLTGFSQTHKIGNNANIGIRGFTMCKQKNPITKCYLNEYWALGPLISSPTLSPNLALACKTETLGSIYSHALLILITHPSLKIKWCMNRLVQKGECWTWNQRLRDSILTGGNILLLGFLFCFYVVKSLMPIGIIA